ncbi:alpha/beta fold hydrolase [Planococcus shenhongbingii]|uniref:Alpha/beta hydrolase n=1 Tax=Planococcus shenhongbingii TaxID=3058398 RepID=A0ABT8NFY6_9BACL|nr:alpha/beta hydrolase [Planococcus sp. N017]MDN7246805.1 alpha/beta hydrolase [Planococcus sp. N017]
MPYATIEDSVSLYYRVEGEGVPIVFIHPPVLGYKVFKHQEKLAHSWQTIFYDLRGHGQSSRGNTSLSIDLLANDLKKLLDKIGISKAVICGFSNGGTIAQEFALLYPEHTSALILSGGYPKVDHLSLKSKVYFGMVMAKLRRIPTVAKMQAKTHKYFERDEQELFDYAKKADGEKVYEYCKAGLHYNATPFLHRLTMPILLIYGDLEKTMHRHRKPYLKAARNVEVIYVKGISHEVPPKKFPEFNEIVHNFLQKNKQAGFLD